MPIARIGLMLLGLLLLASLQALDLIVDGQVRSRIVIPDAPLPVHRSAAEELQVHVRRACGAELPILAEGQAPAGPGCIYLGPCKRTLALGIWPQATKPNGYVIRVVGPDLFICGDDSNGNVFWVQHANRTRVGTLFGVYELLERELQVRWLWPGELGTVVPRRRTITIGAWDETGAPPFIHARWADYGMVSRQEGWSTNEVRERFIEDQARWLRRHRFALGVAMDMAHAFAHWWEPKGKEHPEFFNQLPDGSRRPDPTFYSGDPELVSMCVGEPRLWAEIVANWQRTRTPVVPYIDASENDTNGKCVCEKCLALDVPDPLCTTPFAERVARCKEDFERGKTGWESHLGSLSDRYARYFLAVQKAAEPFDPAATVMGLAYASAVRPPLQTKLNPRILIGIVPAFYFPWTAEKRRLAREQWDGWANTGASMFLRPNYMLDGHNLPLFFARALGEDFAYAAAHGLIGTTFDSLTGQYATQGANLYMLARLHDDPTVPVPQVLDEYCSGFGPAADAVRRYLGLWEDVAARYTPERCARINVHWPNFYVDADAVFTPAVMEQAHGILREGRAVARDDAEVSARLEFLATGLRHAELTLETQQAHRAFLKERDWSAYGAALARLDAFRAGLEDGCSSNLAFLNWTESFTWGRAAARLMAQPHEQLPARWQFAFDPERQGEAQQWSAPKFDRARWPQVTAVGTWDTQDVGKAWKAEHGADYRGVAWYCSSFAAAAAKEAWLVFGAVATACQVWVNGERVLVRPAPIWGSPDAWTQPFAVDISKVVRPGQPNAVAVRVECSSGPGGIWQPVWVVYPR